MSCSTLPDSLTPSAAVGSSMMMTRLPKAAARATATPWRWPPDSVSTAWLMSWMVSSPSLLSSAARVVAHPLEVQHPEDRPADARPASFAAQEQVGGDIQGRAHGQGLVDRLDAGGLGVVGRLELDRLAIQQDLALIGDDRAREALDERRLARAVIADDTQHLARIEVEVGVVECHDPPVRLDQVPALQDRLGRGSAVTSRPS